MAELQVSESEVAVLRQGLKPSWDGVRARIERALKAAKREAQDTQLLAVSKRHPAAAVCALYDLGQRDFGENYVQELVAKKKAVEDTGRCVRWHFTGRLQRRKAALIVHHCDVVHSLSRPEEAAALAIAAKKLPRASSLQVYVQVSEDGDEARGGVTTAGVRFVIEEAQRGGLEVAGLMGVPKDAKNPKLFFESLRVTTAALVAEGMLNHTLLSMGMSADLDVAIASGATIVRVGTALFGVREPSPL